MSKTIVSESASGKLVVTSLWAGAMRPAEIVHHAAVIVHHDAVLDADGTQISPARDEVIAEAYHETVTPAETEDQFVARMIAASVPEGAHHVVIDTSALPSSPPEHWNVDWSAGTITTDAVKAGAAAQSALLEKYEAAVQSALDATAKSRGYSNADRLASYVSSTTPVWSAEASAFVVWRDAVWAYALGLLAQVTAGQMQPPALDAFVAGIPPITWPQGT